MSCALSLWRPTRIGGCRPRVDPKAPAAARPLIELTVADSRRTLRCPTKAGRSQIHVVGTRTAFPFPTWRAPNVEGTEMAPVQRAGLAVRPLGVAGVQGTALLLGSIPPLQADRGRQRSRAVRPSRFRRSDIPSCSLPSAAERPSVSTLSSLIDTSTVRSFAAPDDEADRAAGAVVFLLCCGFFALFAPGGFDESRQARALIDAGLTPRQIALGVATLSFVLAVWMGVVWRRLARARPTAIAMSPTELAMITDAGVVESSWSEVGEVSVAWESRVQTLRVPLAAGLDGVVTVPSTAVVGDVEKIARLIEAYRGAHSGHAG